MMHYVKVRPRLVLAAASGAVLWFLLPVHIHPSTRLLLSWDAAIGFYLALVFRMMLHSDTDKIRFRAAAQDEGRWVILAMITCTSIASLAAILAELSAAKALSGFAKAEHIGLAALTVFLSWTFLHTMYALHYAHEFYRAGKGKTLEGLEFPGQCHKPDYWDFIYYSFIIGTACATADINLTSGMMRKITTIHCMVAFFFNTTILALTINIAAGLT